MPKYRLKQAQGSIPANTVLTSDDYYYISVISSESATAIKYDVQDIPLLIEQSYIEEVPEPKWTDKDMINFAETMVLVARLKGDVIPITREDYINGINVYELNRGDVKCQNTD